MGTIVNITRGYLKKTSKTLNKMDIELNEVGDQNEPAEETNDVEEDTDFGWVSRGDDLLVDNPSERPIIGGDPLDLGNIPNVSKNIGGMRRVFTRDRRDFLRDVLKVSLNEATDQTPQYCFTTSSLLMTKELVKTEQNLSV